jgi:predicted  nucleic acid-binding Zn-ribbon protein
MSGRRWGLITTSLLLAVLVAWAGTQYARSTERERRLRAELKQVYLDAESLRSVATQWQERAMLLEQQTAALAAERDALTKRLRDLEAELAPLKGRRGARPPARR